MSSLPSHAPHAATPTSRCKTHTEALGSKNIRPEGHRSHDTIQMRCLQEGSDANGATIARPQWSGISPLDVNARGNTTPPTGKAAPYGVAVAQAFAQKPTSAYAGPRSRPSHHQTPSMMCPAAPRKPHQTGVDAPAARGSRKAASAATPSDKTTCGDGPDSTCRDRRRPAARRRCPRRPAARAPPPRAAAAASKPGTTTSL